MGGNMASSRILSEIGWGVKKDYEKFNKKTQIGWKWTQKNKRPMILFKSDIDKDNNPAKRGKMLPH